MEPRPKRRRSLQEEIDLLHSGVRAYQRILSTNEYLAKGITDDIKTVLAVGSEIIEPRLKELTRLR